MKSILAEIDYSFLPDREASINGEVQDDREPLAVLNRTTPFSNLRDLAGVRVVELQYIRPFDLDGDYEKNSRRERLENEIRVVLQGNWMF